MSPIRLTNRLLAAGFGLSLLLASDLSVPVAFAASATTQNVVMRAAAAVNAQGKIEVRVRWSLQDGWLPDGGFNIYRFDGTLAATGTTAPLNRSPLGVLTAGNVPATVQTGQKHSLALASLLGKSTATGATSALPPLSTTVTRGASAQTQFDLLAAAARTAHSAPASQAAIATAAKTVVGTPSTGGTPQTAAPPKVVAQPAKRVAPTVTDVAMQARRTLILGAALHSEVASTLGLSFDDPNVAAGNTYTYRLTGAKDGTQLATTTITVPSDASSLKPAVPSGLQAQQLNADSVALRWTRLSAGDEAALGVAQYDIYRLSLPDTMAATPATAQTVSKQGVKLNDVPVIVTDNVSSGAASTGSGASSVVATEAPSFFTDTTPPVTAVTYRITVTDIFGRTSDPAQLSFTVQDWHKPLPVPFVSATLMPQRAAQQAAFLAARARQYHRATPFFKGALGTSPPAQQALIAWTPSYQDPRLNNIWESSRSPDPGIAFQIYRIDTEQPNQTPVLLTATPITPTLTPAAQLPSAMPVSTLVPSVQLQANSARDALATAACLQIAQGTGFTAAQAGCTTLSTNPQWENTLLSPLNVYTYTDTGISKDHYYQYLVVAVFTRNSQQSSPSASNIVAYPNLTPPGAVSSLATSFRVITPAKLTPSPAKPAPVPPAVKGGSTAAHASGLTLSDWSAPLVRAAPRDWGGELTLTWTAGQQDAKYEIYRANATRPKSIQQAPATSSASGCIASPSGGGASGAASGGAASGSHGGTSGAAPSGGGSGTAHAVATSNASVALVGAHPCLLTSISAVSLSWQTFGDPFGAGGGTGGLKDSDFVLLGTTKQPTYVDELSRSSAEYYVYRVVPLNRWNVPGPLLSIAVRAPATLPPTKPKLIVGTPAVDGGVQVEFVPDGDSGEEIVTYELWRSTLSQGGVAAGGTGGSVGTTAGTNAAGSSGAGTPASVAASHVALVSSAARYGVLTRQSTVAAALRSGNGVSPLASLTPGQLLAMRSTRVATVKPSDLPAGSGNGAWLVEAPSSALDWRNEYVYWVRAIDSDQLHSDSDLVDVEPLKVSASAPTGFNATWNATQCAVNLTWQRTDPDTAGFLVERELAPTGTGSGSSTGTAVSSGGQRITTGLSVATIAPDNYTQLSGITAATAVSYSDGSAFPDSSYFYRVRTVDQAGNESDPAVLASAVAIPDGCGNTTIHQVQQTSSSGSASAAGSASAPRGASGAASAPAAESATPVTSPAAPAVPKPADEIDIPTTRKP